MRSRTRFRSSAIAVGVALILGVFASSSTGIAAAMADDGALSFTSAPTPGVISTSVVGRTTTAEVIQWTPTPDSVSYQWFKNGSPIDGATDISYTPVESDLGAKLTVSETGTKAGYSSLTEVSPSGSTVIGLLTTTGVTISGGLFPGDVLTVHPGTWNTSDVTLSYTWEAPSGVQDSDPTYTVSTWDQGETVSVLVTAAKPGWTTARIWSAVTIDYNQVVSRPVVVTGQAAVGQTLSAALSGWRPTPLTFDYQWLSDGTIIPGATSSTYSLGYGDVGHRLSVSVTGHANGLLPATEVSSPTAAVLTLFSSTPSPVITGTYELGHTLTAKVPPWTPVATTMYYEWYINGVQQLGGSTFLLNDPTLVGQTVTVEVIGSSATTASAVAMSSPTPPIAEGFADLSHITIGSVHLNVAVAPKLGDVPATAPINYQWTINGVAIHGATSATYVPQPGDYGKKLRVTVSVAGGSDGYAPASGTSNAQTVGIGYYSSTGGTTISGVARVGQTLTATETWDVPGVHVKYEWVTWNDPMKVLSTSRTYTLRASDLGQIVLGMSQPSAPHFESMEGWWGDQVGPIGRGVFANSPTVSVTGSMLVGSTLSAHHTSVSPSSGVTYHYQWYSKASSSSSAVAIAHATSATYKIPTAQRGHILTVRVTATKSVYTSTSGTSSTNIPVIERYQRSAPTTHSLLRDLL
jgi:hypothetical protein